MMARVPLFTRLVIAVAVAFASLLLLPHGAAYAAPAVAIYTGEALTASGPARRIELQLSADGKMTWVTDYRNSRPPIIGAGRWNAISVEEIEVIVEHRDGKQVEPTAVRFLKQGDTLRSTAASATEFGSQGLLLKLAKAPTPPIAVPVTGAISPGGAWQWESLITSAEKVAVVDPGRYKLQLQAGGKAQVLADCNRGQASYSFEGRNFKIRITGMTRAACPAGSLSGRYLKALEAAVSQRVRGDNLFLDLPANGGTMKFVRAK
jgi:heat shock protein HslJ